MENKTNLFFILGNPRSGTSLLRRMLDNHSLISIPPECNFLSGLYDKFGEKQLEGSDKAIFLKELSEFPKFRDLGINIDVINSFWSNGSKNSLKDIYLKIQEYYAIRMKNEPVLESTIFGDKNRFWQKSVRIIHSCFPESKVIHIVRDPRDIIVSYRALNQKKSDNPFFPKLPESADEIFIEWILNNEAIRNMGKSHGLLPVKYEDLVQTTKDVLQEIMAFLELNFEDAMLEYYKKDIFGISEPESHFEWKNKLTLPPDSENIGKYKDLLSGKELEIIKSRYNEVLVEYGYEAE